MIVGIVGSRRRASEVDYAKLEAKLIDLEEKQKIRKIVTGDCDEGGDNFARIYAKKHKKRLVVKYKKKDGKRWVHQKCSGRVTYFEFTKMCYDRNIEVVKEHLTFLIALPSRDRTGGTEHTIKQFKIHDKHWQRKLIII